MDEHVDAMVVVLGAALGGEGVLDPALGGEGITGVGLQKIVALVGRWSEPLAGNTTTALKIVFTGTQVKSGDCYDATIERVSPSLREPQPRPVVKHLPRICSGSAAEFVLLGQTIRPDEVLRFVLTIEEE
jgi:hypothetical protein